MATEAASLLEAIRTRRLVVGIIGLGHVGLALALTCSKAGYRIVGFDTHETRVAGLNRGESPIRHVPGGEIIQMIETGFEATTNFARAADCDVLIVSLDLPPGTQRAFDFDPVLAVMSEIAAHLRPGQIVSMESLVPPGTCDEQIAPVIERVGLRPGHDIFLVSSPRPGDISVPVSRIVAGHTEACKTIGAAFYGSLAENIVPVSSTRAAELACVFGHARRAVSIALDNELVMLSDALALDPFEIMHLAAHTGRTEQPESLRPGAPGPEEAISPFLLSSTARQSAVGMKLVEQAGEVNEGMPVWSLLKVIRTLNEKGLAIRGTKLLALGVARQRNASDIRASQALRLIELLIEWGAVVSYCDTYVPKIERLGPENASLSSATLSAERLASSDAVLFLTGHSYFDVALIRAHSGCLIDLRSHSVPKAGNARN